MLPIEWDDAPSFPNRLDVQVHAVKENSTSFIRLLGPHQGVWVHTIQVGRHKRPKPHHTKDCPHCSPKNEKVWKPYVASLLYNPKFSGRWGYVVLELTAAAFEDVTLVVQPEHWRGQVIEVSRGKTNARLRARWCEDWTRDLGVLPPPFDVRPVLERLWGIDQVKPNGEPRPYAKPVTLAELAPLEPTKKVEETTPPGETFHQMRARLLNGIGGAH